MRSRGQSEDAGGDIVWPSANSAAPKKQDAAEEPEPSVDLDSMWPSQKPANKNATLSNGADSAELQELRDNMKKMEEEH